MTSSNRDASGTITVAGDIHLGAGNADVEAFQGFLDEQYRRAGPGDSLVLLGDVLDLVRRDPFGCAWETSDTVTRIRRLAEVVPVYFVLGNHDRHLGTLDAGRYDVRFREEVVLESGDARIRFRHGQSFDPLHSERLSAYLSGPGDRGDIDPTRGLKDPVVAKGRDLVQQERRRLRSALARLRGRDEYGGHVFPRRERRAHDYLSTIPEDKLVFGHTHSPYVHPENVAANPGSWKRTAPLHNTYLRIRAGTISLHRHRRAGEDEELDHVGPAAD